MKRYSFAAKSYIAAILAAGLLTMGTSVYGGQWTNFWRFLLYLVLFAPASGLKVRLPGILGTMSANQVFVFLAVIELSLAEVVVLGALGGLFQTLWQAEKRPTFLQSVFNAAEMTLSVTAAHHIFHLEGMPGIGTYTVVRLTGAACGFFLTNTLIIAVVIALTEHKPAFGVWRSSYLWSFPYYLLAATLAGGLNALSDTYGWQVVVLGLPVLYVIYRSYSLHVDRLESEKKHAEDVASLHLQTIEALAAAIEAKDETTHDHLERVQVYSLEIGKKLGLNSKELSALRAASLLHDIGKLAVPTHIISKPGKLTPEEFEKMKIHPVVGAEILERVSFPYPVAPIVRHHHEKWDGSGYPDGIAGEEIPLGARILSAVDCFDALASDRQYRRALPLDKAMDVVRSEAGKSYDPRVVELLENNYRAWEKMAHGQDPVREKIDTSIQVTRGEAPAAGFAAEEVLGGNRDGPNPANRQAVLDLIARARTDLQSVERLSLNPAVAPDLEVLLATLDYRLQRSLRYDCLALYLRLEERLVARYVRGEDSELFRSLQIPIGEGISGWTIENQCPMLNGNPSVESGYLRDPAKFSTLRSALAVPLRGRSRYVAVMTLYSRQSAAFTQTDLQTLLAIRGRLSRMVERAVEWQPAEASTGESEVLPNSGGWLPLNDLDEALSQRGDVEDPLAVVVFEVSHREPLHQPPGWTVTTQTARAFGARLQTRCGPDGHVTRTGPREWMAVLPGYDTARAGDLATDLAREFETAPAKTHEALTVSVGVAAYPDDGAAAEILVAEAERRLNPVDGPSGERVTSTEDLISLANQTGEGAGSAGGVQPRTLPAWKPGSARNV